MVACKDEQRQFEQYWIEELNPTLNTFRAHNTEEQTKQYKERYYQDNKESILRQTKQYRQDNKEHILQYYQNNKEQIKQYNKQHYQDNKEHISQQRKQRYQNKKKMRVCSCGKTYDEGDKCGRYRHYQSKFHSDFVGRFYEVLGK